MLPPCDILPLRDTALALPAFFPDATRGVVRSLDSQDLEACGVEGLVVNAFHLSRDPGCSVISRLGGLHRFMNWRFPILTDSGGFQVYSLALRGNRSVVVSEHGMRYADPRTQDRKWLTPEKSIASQFQLGADIMVCLDHCTHPDAPAEQQRASVENTVSWAARCRAEFHRRTRDAAHRPLLFAVIQGGHDMALRKQCADRLLEMGFDGYGFGGWPVREDGCLYDSVSYVAELVPRQLPLWALGIGKPEHLHNCTAAGYSLFDCVLPTRDARHGRLYAFLVSPTAGSAPQYDYVQIENERHRRDDAPIDATCDCIVCRRYSRAYVHHLFVVRDMLAARLATMHNLRFYTRLIEALRAARSPSVDAPGD
jgi:queuine tRNA-ribosyltransferase